MVSKNLKRQMFTFEITKTVLQFTNNEVADMY